MSKTNKEIIEEVLKGYHPSYNNNRITDMLEKALQLKEQEMKQNEIKFLEGNGAKNIQDNLDKSFKGTFESALKNGYKMDKHYVIVDWVFFHELLERENERVR